MQELLRNAWLGWQNYIDAGKYVVFAMVVLLLFWFGNEKGQDAVDELTDCAEIEHECITKRALFLYGTIMVLACICPITAAILMVYQTRFYDYQWIWSLVPVTLLIGVGFVGFYLCHVDRLKRGAKAVLVALAVATMVLAGRMGAPIEEAVETGQLEATKTVVAELIEQSGDGVICLWAPQEIVTYVRALDGEIVLPYGRDMWDGHLGAYSYDTYTPEAEALYRYMSGVERWGEYNPSVEDEQGQTIILQGDEYLKQAVNMGITHILLPRNSLPETVQQAEQVLEGAAQEIEGYYLFVLAQ